jgi:hypothetical protein
MSSSQELKKLAELMRRHSQNLNEKKTEKVANILLASTALELLRRKIYR